MINPDTVYLTAEGQVEFGHAHKVQQYANYMAPETEDDFTCTDTSVEQVIMTQLYFVPHLSIVRSTCTSGHVMHKYDIFILLTFCSLKLC